MSAPYYEDDLVTLYHGDCLEVRTWLDADVLVTDPPYGRAWKQGDTGSRRGWASDRNEGIANDETTATRDAALRLWSARPAVVFGDLMLPPPERVRQVLIYAKGSSAGFTGAVGGYRRDAEAVYLLGPHPSGLGGQSSVLRSSGPTPNNLSKQIGHPHTKPVDVLSNLIASTTGVVADPFSGSGSALVAAKQLGRRAIGVELDERYCEIAARRLAQGVLDFGESA